MEEPNKIHVFKSFEPYFSILKVYSSETYKKDTRTGFVKSVCLTCGVTLFIGFVPFMIGLAIWCLFDNADLSEVIVGIPLVLTISHIFMSFIAMANKCRAIIGTFGRLQDVINQSKHFVLRIFWKNWKNRVFFKQSTLNKAIFLFM